MEYTVNHIALVVDDLSWMVDFFEKAFGWEATRSNGTPVSQVWFDKQNVQVDVGHPLEKGNLSHLAINVKTLDEALQEIGKFTSYQVLSKGPNWIELPNKIILELMVQ